MFELEHWSGVGHLLPAGAGWGMLVGALLAVNAVTWGLYAHDKRAARRRGARRVPERTLHTFEFLGGWPAALLAQRWLRHKTLKHSYRRVFWRIVALHLLVMIGILAWWAAALPGG